MEKVNKPFASFSIMDDWPDKVTTIEAHKSKPEINAPDTFHSNTFTKRMGYYDLEWNSNYSMTWGEFMKEYQRQVSLAPSKLKEMEAA